MSQSNNLTPTIISIADATHYLVGGMDKSNNFSALAEAKKIVSVTSLSQAKQFLGSLDINNATIEYQTSYDEMCGTAAKQPCRQKVYF